VVTAPLSKTQKRNLRRRLAVKRGDKPKFRLDLGKVPPSVCRKYLAYADRSIVKRTKQNESRCPESEDPLVPYFYSSPENSSQVCQELGPEFYKFHGYFNKYLCLHRHGVEYRSPTTTDWFGFQVVAKVNIPFDTILCYAVGKVKIYMPEDDPPAMNGPHYVNISTHVDTCVTCYDAGYWAYNRMHKADATRYEYNFARFIGSLPPGDPGVNCFVEYIPRYLMFRVRALKPIPAGGVLYIGTAMPNRYHVRRNGVLENYNDSMSRRLAKQIALGKVASANTTTVDLSLS
jgi:hypothetical protein